MHMNLAKLNLNLLRVLDAIFRERSLTLAGRQLGLTQPAVSHALSHLRGILGDELFIRSTSGMVPTQRCSEICVQVGEALRMLESSLSPETFDPKRTTRKFVIACGDYSCTVLAPGIVERFYAAAPHAQLRVLAFNPDIVKQLDAGTVDLLVAGVNEVPSQLVREVLFEDHTVWVMRKDHPLAGRELGPEDFVQQRRVGVALGPARCGGDEGFTRQLGLGQWSAQKEGGRAAPTGNELVVPSFHLALRLISQSDLVAELPRRFAAAMAPQFGLVIHEGAIDRGTVNAIHHRIHGQRPPVAWLRGIVHEAAAEAEARGTMVESGNGTGAAALIGGETDLSPGCNPIAAIHSIARSGHSHSRRRRAH